MRKILSLIIIIIFAPTLIYAAGSETTCSRNTNGEIIDSTACYVTPTLYKTKIFKILLCSKLPSVMNNIRYATVPDGTILDLSSCTGVVFDSAEGHVFDLAVNSKSSIPNVHLSSLDSKTEYKYSVIIASNVIAIKASEKFSSNRNGSGTSVGAYCWTKAMDILQSQMERVESNNQHPFYSNRSEWGTICGTSEGTPGLFSETVDNMGNMVDGDEFNDDFRVVSIDSSNKINENGANNNRLALFAPLERVLKLGGTSKLDIKLKVTNSVEANQNNGTNMPVFMPAPYYVTITAM